MHGCHCCKCKKQMTPKVPEVGRGARHSAEYASTMLELNMAGLSHGKTAAFFGNVLGSQASATKSYRNKISTSRKLVPMRDAIASEILQEPYLKCDELWWPLGKSSGYVLMALGQNGCLARVSYDRKAETLKAFLPGYDGTISQDSYSGWLHIGGRRQMCMQHQIRLPKLDLKYKNPKDDVLKFLEDLKHLLKQYFMADAIEDQHTRQVAANCLDKQMSELIHREMEDDDDKNINRYRKRHAREGYFLTLFLLVPGIKSGNYDVEIMNRKLVAIRHDGGGNRSPIGMEANSILFTIFTTCKARGDVFFDVLKRAIGDG